MCLLNWLGCVPFIPVCKWRPVIAESCFKFQSGFRNHAASFRNGNQKETQPSWAKKLVPKGYQNRIYCDLDNNRSCQTVLKCDKEMQPMHNCKIFHLICKPGVGTLNKITNWRVRDDMQASTWSSMFEWSAYIRTLVGLWFMHLTRENHQVLSKQFCSVKF